MGTKLSFFVHLAIDCGTPPRPSNGAVHLQSGTQLNDIARYSCSDGYWLDGDEERMCEENRQWSGQLPVCQGEELDHYLKTV